ncbi:MAG: HAD-IIIC family phosphatase [Actinomycetota bacterium]|nr:HAD-IIIC family phosphatase [Actinomycetota bacterium]
MNVGDLTAVDRRDGATSAAIRELVASGRYAEAWSALRPRMLAADETAPWLLARNVVRAAARGGWAPATTRQIRLAVLCSYEAAELAGYLELALMALGVGAEVYLAPYGQLEQELLGEGAALSQFGPTHVLIAPSTADLAFPELAPDPHELLDAAESRWRSLWDAARREHDARVVQHAFVVPDETPMGHLAMRLEGSRSSLVHALNRRLAIAAGSQVLLVDCDRLAARIGKQRWCDPRLWYAARQPFGHEALPLLARDTAAVLAGDVGLSARCLIVDLDNTLWGGVVGEEGVDGIAIGTGPDGEAYAAFQEYLAALRARGMILAVASKNDIATAREPFERTPGMRLGLEDFAAFVADWRRKPEQIREIASTLGLGLDSLAFADDNPAECAEVAAALPEVTVIPLAVPASELVRTLAASPRMELSSLATDDLARGRSYAARAQSERLRGSVASLEDFWRSLDMRAQVRALDERTLDRAAQLTQKTNQFNLTLRRRSREQLESLAADKRTICRTLALADRFADHGLVGFGVVVPSEDDPHIAEIDTLLLSCRVIGRTAERHLVAHLAREAREAGYERIRGTYVPGPRNALVAELYPALGFLSAGTNGARWELELTEASTIDTPYIANDA